MRRRAGAERPPVFFPRDRVLGAPDREADVSPSPDKSQYLRGRDALCKQVVDHLAPLIRQPHAEPFVWDGKPAMVEAELMQDGGMQVVDVNGVLGDAPADLVGLAVG